MQEVLLAECRRLFRPHPNLGDEVNRNIVQSEIDGGVFLGDLPPSTVLQIHTQHRSRNAFWTDFGWRRTQHAARFTPKA